MIEDPHIYLVFWGSKWLSDSTHQNLKTQVENTFKELAGSQHNNILTQYNNQTSDPNGNIHNDAWLKDSQIDSTTPIYGLTLLDIGDEAVTMQDRFGWPQDKDTLVLVFPEQGTTYLQVDPVFNFHFCGAHYYNDGHQLAYAGVRYIDSGAGCGGTGDVIQDTIGTALHEYAESVTDPNLYYNGFNFDGSGWHTGDFSFLSMPKQVADLCENYQNASTGSSLTPITVPYLWGEDVSGCMLSAGQEFPSPDYTGPFTGKHTVQGDILSAYNAIGGPNSWLGKPTTEEFPIPGGRESAFEHGEIIWNASTKAITVNSYVGYTIAAVAIGHVGGTCGQYYNCEAPGEWCSDFARWVWAQSGVNVSGLSAWAASFYDYGLRYGTLSSTPHVSDAVVYEYNPSTDFAAHVAIVTNVNTDNHTITSVGGNERGGAGIVAADGPYNWTVGGAPTGQVISGYISPSGTFTGGSGGGGSSAVPAPPGGSAPPSGYVAPTAHYWVDTFANAPGYGAGGAHVGTLYAGTNYVFFRQWGNKVSDSSGNYNHWWLWTDLDTGGQGWVSAYYLSLWGNDVAKDNSGTVIPNCS